MSLLISESGSEPITTAEAKAWAKYYHDKIYTEENYQKLARELFKKSKENLNYTEQNEMCRVAVRRWLERIRKKTGRSIRHWMVTEREKTTAGYTCME